MQSEPFQRPKTLFITCGAIAREVTSLLGQSGWSNVQITCLPASWHNTPGKIAPGIESKITKHRKNYDEIFVLYGDCGTGGELDKILKSKSIERIPGPHCYEFFMGKNEFLKTHTDEPGCFYLTDYLVRHFDKLIIKGLGLERYPELIGDYFKNYNKLIYIAQTSDSKLEKKARIAAEYLGLEFEYRYRGYGELSTFIEAALSKRPNN